jgi:hypothetical protein
METTRPITHRLRLTLACLDTASAAKAAATIVAFVLIAGNRLSGFLRKLLSIALSPLRTDWFLKHKLEIETRAALLRRQSNKLVPSAWNAKRTRQQLSVAG